MTSDLPAEDRDGFRFRGGHEALDLVATLQARLGPAPRETLSSPEDLDRWLISAGLAASPPKAAKHDLEDARSLREAIYRLVTDAGPHLDRSALSVLNRLAAAKPPAPALSPDGALILKASAQELIALLARETVYLLGGDDRVRIRKCASATCGIYFLDASRTGKRRWCSMKACGNKAKVAAHRKRDPRP